MQTTAQITQENIEEASKLLLAGELVAFPTETVYGLGACLFYPEAIKKIFSVKGRPSDNPLIVHISDLAILDTIAKDIPEVFYTLAKRFFPGPLTVVLSRASIVPDIVSGGLPTIAVRMPNHPVALALLKAVGQPLVAPSANLSGKPSATQSSHVLDDFAGKIAGVVLQQEPGIGIESTVVSVFGNEVKILRPGTITQELLQDCVGPNIRVTVYQKQALNPEAIPSPGMKYTHYAPEAKVFLYTKKEEIQYHCEVNECQGLRMILTNNPGELEGNFYTRVLPLNPATFYANLRLADDLNCVEVLLLCDVDVQRNLGFMNRIERSAGIVK